MPKPVLFTYRKKFIKAARKAKSTLKKIIRLIKVVRIMYPKIHLSVEKWKWSNEYDVFVSNKGRILKKNGQPAKTYMARGGYFAIPTKGRYQRIHTIVMETWKPIENRTGMTIDHLDQNKRNNSVDNLEWVTEEENRARAMERVEVRD